MNRNFKIITINGMRGMIMAVFIVLGLIAGFILSPAWVCMKLWNFAFQQSNYVAAMNIYQGLILWSIIALSFYALNNRRPLIGFGISQGLSKEQIKDIMERAKDAQFKELKEFEMLAKKNENIKSVDNDEINSSTKFFDKDYGLNYGTVTLKNENLDCNNEQNSECSSVEEKEEVKN